ncbi:hypothetical protein [Lacinutrix sp. Bg11-31]|uniref:hypothetical protein n=1 Tax=Lacinutrix sp. Bg11-31 TaxID=2057808 RepID=UPI000C314486|nr:hypothetical protein [Lacinutrix sp. Bg11-31]AUC83404.1 hypothetical protein CW733_15195 [Lacinutrix sp. Bg11-31]
MKLSFKITKITKIINFIALLFVLLGPYGIAITGGLQVLSGIIFILLFPKNKLIYIYFGLVIFFFLIWNGGFDWFFLLPAFLVCFLTYIIHTQKLEPQQNIITTE